MQGHEVATKKSIKYLGVLFDKDMKMRKHVIHSVSRADQVTGKLTRLLPRVKGPRSSKRRVLNLAVESILLYAAPIWIRAIKFQKYKDLLTRVQRRMAIRICRAYKTISTPAVQLIAGTIPIDLLAEERVELHKRGRESRPEIQAETRQKWQMRWQRIKDKTEWTKRLIPNIGIWLDRKHGEVSHHLTQVISGHGCFQPYLERFKIIEDASCTYCRKENDSVEHSIFYCHKWRNERT